MRIVLRKEISNTDAEEYHFNLFDRFYLVLVKYYQEKKPQGKRKWILDNLWDKYDERRSNIGEPVLSDQLKHEAFTEYFKTIQENTKILTWKEWKNK